MKLLFSFLALLVLLSCKQEDKVVLKEDFIFTTTTKSENTLSLRFQKDTVFLAWDLPGNDSVYYFLLDEIEMDSINFFLNSLKFKNFKEEYYQRNLQDGRLCQFEFIKPSKRILIYGHYDLKEIKGLSDFARYLSDLYFSKRRFGFRNTVYYEGQKTYWSKDVDFGNIERFVLPNIPYDTLY